VIEERQVPQMQRHELQQQVAASGMTERIETDPLNLTTQRVGRVPCQSDDTSEDDSTSAAPDDTSDDDSTSVAPDDTSEDDSTSAAPDDTSDDDSTSAAPPLLSAGETTAGKTLPSVSVPPIVGSKAREQRVSDVTAKVDAKRMQKSGGKQVSWSRTEHLKLMQAVDRHGRDWVSVSRDVGRKTSLQCYNKVIKKVAAGRMEEPGGKQE
jgi:hypothetical protein